jgi:hypothetical protein
MAAKIESLKARPPMPKPERRFAGAYGVELIAIRLAAIQIRAIEVRVISMKLPRELVRGLALDGRD